MVVWRYATDAQRAEAAKINETARSQGRRPSREERKRIFEIERSIKLPDNVDLQKEVEKLKSKQAGPISVRPYSRNERRVVWRYATQAQIDEVNKIQASAKSEGRRLSKDERAKIAEIERSIKLPADIDLKKEEFKVEMADRLNLETEEKFAQSEADIIRERAKAERRMLNAGELERVSQMEEIIKICKTVKAERRRPTDDERKRIIEMKMITEIKDSDRTIEIVDSEKKPQ